ncbi:MAG TPA: glycosyltransferase family 4 protein [Chitinophagaceae bacterium]|nr:glycosyltransferase family 4 protein [Chitinophagaceae bacterium]
MPKLVRITTTTLSLKYLLRNQMRFMKQHGFDVIMISSDGPEKEDVVKNEGCSHQVINMTRKITPFADLRSLWKLYRVLKKEKPDIVHSHTPKAGLLAMLAARMAGIKVRVHTVAGLRFMTTTGLTRKLLVAMEKLTMRSATDIWPNSFSLRDYMISNKLARPSRLEVVGMGSSNGIDLERFHDDVLKKEEIERVKKLIQYDEQHTYLLTVGRIVHDKGIDELVKAFNEVYKKNNHLRLLLVGTFEDELDPVTPESRALLQSHPGIILAGWNEGVEYFMHIADMLIHPSHREGFPNVLLQAGAMKCPIICSRIEGNVDIVEHEKTGLIFETKNAAQLQQKIEQALADPRGMRQYADQLLQKVKAHFSQPAVHGYLLEKYNYLLDQRTAHKKTKS